MTKQYDICLLPGDGIGLRYHILRTVLPLTQRTPQGGERSIETLARMGIIHLRPHLLRNHPTVHKGIDRKHEARSKRTCLLALPNLIGQGMAVAQHVKAAKEVDSYLPHIGSPQIEHRLI